MKKLILVLFVVLTFLLVGINTSGTLSAQTLKLPQASQKATVTQTIGLTDVTVIYHRPGVKSRTIWGELVPFDKVWRAGANEATTIQFSTDVKIEGQSLVAGTYSLFVIPHEEMGATIIFSKQSGLWGASGYKEEMDALRIEISAKEAPFVEWLMYYFEDLADNSASLFFHWEKVRAKIKIEVDTKTAILKSAEKTFSRYWVEPYQAANYAFGKELYQQALKWVTISTSIEHTFWNIQLQAKISKKLAKTKKEHKKALKTLEKAIMLGSKLNKGLQDTYVSKAKKLLQEWKIKK